MDDEIIKNTSSGNKNKTLSIIFFICLPILLIGGYFFFSDNGNERPPALSTHPYPSTSPMNSSKPSEGLGGFENISFVEDDSYFSDEFVLVSKNTPQFVVMGYVTRSQATKNYAQRATIHVFENGQWKKYSTSNSVNTASIHPDTLVEKWTSHIRTSKTLEEFQEINLNTDKKIRIQTNVLSNEMAVRSLPSYTKFLSEGSAQVEYNGRVDEAYFAYTRIYSNNLSLTPFNNSSFYDASNRFTTDWLVF